MMKKLVWLMILGISILSCVSEFTPEVEGVSGILVVDGTITNGESIIKLSRSVGILDTLTGDEAVTNASMYVERSDGATFSAVHEGSGTYRIETGDLDPDLEYRLTFTINGVEYQSSYLTPMQTAEIDSISYSKADQGEPVIISVNTHATDDMSPYYRWGYEENWELKAQLFANHGFVNGVLTNYSLLSSTNTYYCWGKDSSNVLLIGSTVDLSENTVKDMELLEIPCSNEKLSILYHIQVSQMQIREEAYDYFRVMLDGIERTGGLFNVVMSAGENGNVFNVEDPTEIVIGYVDVAETTTLGVYITNTETNFYEDPYDVCEIETAEDYTFSHYWVDYYEMTYSTEECVDCRKHYNASKNKPSWWPTDHL